MQRVKNRKDKSKLGCISELKGKKKKPDSHRERGKHEHDEATGNKSK